MKAILKTFPIIGQQKGTWCGDACTLNAVSMRLWEKYRIIKTFDVNEFFKNNHFEHSIFEKIFSALKQTLPSNVFLKSIYHRKMSFPEIKRHILKRVPLVVTIDKWGVKDGVLGDGDNVAHAFVLYGFDDEVVYLQNPWGDKYYCTLPRTELYRIGSFTSII